MVFASNNKSKLQEIKEIFNDYKIESLKDKNVTLDVEEDKTTFYENALKKAISYYNEIKEPVIADDSGLIVSELNWPGVYTNRFLGNNKTDREKNLAIINRVDKECQTRNAEVVCVLVYYDGKNTISATGKLKGKIPSHPRGENGFGFDEIFEYKNKTLAELSTSEKNNLSARKLAAEELKKKLLSTTSVDKTKYMV